MEKKRYICDSWPDCDCVERKDCPHDNPPLRHDGYQPTNTVDTSNPPRQKPTEEDVSRGAEETFCKIYSAEYGEKVDSIYQIKIDTFDGLELLTLCQKYATQERKQAREKAIKECINCFDSLFLISPTDTEEVAKQLKESYNAMLKLKHQ